MAANSIISLFFDESKARGVRVAAQYKPGGETAWRSESWAEMARRVRSVASGLVALGLKPGQPVAVLSNTRYEWVLADLGILAAGGFTVPIYPSNLPEECAYVLNDSGAVMVFAEDAAQVAKLKEVRAKVPNVQKVIVFQGEPAPAQGAADGDFVMPFTELERRGVEGTSNGGTGAEVDRRIAGVAPQNVLTVIYTSGTTGPPKGVVLTHAALLYEIDAIRQIALVRGEDLQLLFLPLAHSFAKVLECAWLGLGHVMAFAESLDKITQNMAEVRPTVVCAVPRIFEKVYTKVVSGALDAGGLKAKLFAWALAVSDRVADARLAGREPAMGDALQLALARALVFTKVSARLGGVFGGRVRYFVSGGAPLSKKMQYFFEHAGVVILEGFGLTETSAATCINRPGNNKIGTVGPAVPGTELKIAPDGEILIRGPGVLREYWGKPDATREVLEPDGWFHTGDIGEIDRDGCLKITDRKKDIIVTAGGKNVAPQNIEGLLKTNPLISQVMVHGDQRKFLSALLTLDKDNLEKLAKERGIAYSSYPDLVKKDEVRAHVEAILAELNRHLASYETIKKFAILESDFAVGHELTPTLKVKRKFCNQKYKQILDRFYEGSPP